MIVTDENGESKQVDANKFFEKKKQRGRPVHTSDLKKIKMGLYVLPHQKKKFEKLAIEFGLNSSQLMAYIIDELSIDTLKKKFYLEPVDSETRWDVSTKTSQKKYRAAYLSKHVLSLEQKVQTSKGVFLFNEIIEIFAYLEFCWNQKSPKGLENTPLERSNFSLEDNFDTRIAFQNLLLDAGFRQKEAERIVRVADRIEKHITSRNEILWHDIWKVKDFSKIIYLLEIDEDLTEMKFPENNKLAKLLISQLPKTEE